MKSFRGLGRSGQKGMKRVMWIRFNINEGHHEMGRRLF